MLTLGMRTLYIYHHMPYVVKKAKNTYTSMYLFIGDEFVCVDVVKPLFFTPPHIFLGCFAFCFTRSASKRI